MKVELFGKPIGGKARNWTTNDFPASSSDNVCDVSFNKKPYKLHSVTGRVLDTNTRSETEVHGSGGGGGEHAAPVNITSTTTRYTKIFLIEKDKTEHAIELVNFDVKCRRGNVLTLIWAIRQGKNKGYYIITYNHNTKDVEFNDYVLHHLVKPKMYTWYAIVGTAVLFVLIFHSLGSFIGGAVLGAIGGMIVTMVIRTVRVGKFKSTEVLRIVDALKSAQHTEL